MSVCFTYYEKTVITDETQQTCKCYHVTFSSKKNKRSYVLQYRKFLMVTCQNSGRRLTWSVVLKGYACAINFLLRYI